MAALHSNAEIFAANRATGHIALSVAALDGRTRRKLVREDGSLRVRFPNAAPEALETGSSLIAGTAAAEKVYRSNGPDAEMTVRLDLAEGARLAWLPQETILFDRARLSRRIDVDLAPGASLLMAEAVVFGRAAMGEFMTEGHVSDHWRVRRDGRLIYAD